MAKSLYSYSPEFVSSTSKIPEGTQFLILHNESMSYDDGYGGTGSKDYLEIRCVDTLEHLEEFIAENKDRFLGTDKSSGWSSKPQYKVIRYIPVNVEISFKVDVKIDK